MTFFDLSLKMLRANFRRYKLYFYSNVFSIMLFYCFAALFTNQSFMNIKIVNSMISSNIIAPSVFVAVFIVLFIPYTYQAFMKNRKHEYGILMTLGMSAGEVLANMFLENCIIAVISLISGLILGTVLSFLFFFFIHQVIGVSALHWSFNKSSYLWTAALYAATILVTLAIGFFRFAKTQLIDLIKEKFRAEKETKALPRLFPAGVLLFALSVLMLLYKHSKFWYLGLTFMFISIYIIIPKAKNPGNCIERVIPGYKQKHLLSTSFIRQHNRSRKKVCFLTTCMIAFAVFFGGLALILFPSQMHNTLSYSPYDLAYSQIFGMNQVKDSQIISLLNQNAVSVKAVKQVDYLRNGAFNLFSVSEVNENFGCHYQVDQGRFLMVFQDDLNDGYKHDLSSLQAICFNCAKTEMKLQSAGRDVKILFNNNPAFADHTLILNDADYSVIASECQDYWQGILKLYTFADWKDSEKGINAVQDYLMKANHVDQTEQSYYRASSRIETYSIGKQSAELFIFLMAFIVALFCTAANVIVHFKIKSESEEEQRMLSRLNRIGLSTDEMLAMIRHKNMIYYLPQVIMGLLMGTLYNYTANKFYGYEWKAALFSLLIGLTLMILQIIFVKRYSRRELLNFGI